MKIIDPGHVYLLKGLGGGDQELRFIKRSGGAIQYKEEWLGLQTQEILRVLIDRTEYLNSIIPCVESEDSLWHLRMALFLYEVRAYRRKHEGLNRKVPEHDDAERPRPWRDGPFQDIPFNEQDIEKYPVGTDGHIILIEITTKRKGEEPC